MSDYTIVDAQDMMLHNPDAFETPTVEELRAIKPGDFCKLSFNNKERMWVKVTARDGFELTGTLNNTPVKVDIGFGEMVRFETRHVYEIMKGETQC